MKPYVRRQAEVVATWTRSPSQSTSSKSCAAPGTPREVARAAVAAISLQLSISNPEARAIAEEAGLRYVEDRCLKVEYARLLGRSRRDG